MKPNNGKTEVDPNELRVVLFRNISGFDFTPEMGAAFDGRPIFVKAGDTKMLPYPVGFKLARNLAKQMLLRREAPKDDAFKEPNGRILWSTETLQEMIQTIITDSYKETAPAPTSQTDIMMHRVAALNDTTGGDESGVDYMTKQDVMNKLTSLKIPFNVRQSKAELTVLLEHTLQDMKNPKGKVVNIPAGMIAEAPEVPGAPKDMTIGEILNPPQNAQ